MQIRRGLVRAAICLSLLLCTIPVDLITDLSCTQTMRNNKAYRCLHSSSCFIRSAPPSPQGEEENGTPRGGFLDQNPSLLRRRVQMSLQHLWEIEIDGPNIVGIGARKLAQQCQLTKTCTGTRSVPQFANVRRWSASGDVRRYHSIIACHEKSHFGRLGHCHLARACHISSSDATTAAEKTCTFAAPNSMTLLPRRNAF